LSASRHVTWSRVVDSTKVLQFKRPRKTPTWIRGARLLAISAALVALELRTSYFQAHVLAYIAQHMTFHLVVGPGDPLAAGFSGPYMRSFDPRFDNLQRVGFRVAAHTEASGLETRAVKIGLPPIYREKTKAGLQIEDDQGRSVYQATTPQRAYQDYDSIPPLIVRSLLFAENREILDASTPYRNPTVEWTRLAPILFT